MCIRDRYKDEDFFLTVSYDEPHGPSLCPEPYNTMYQGFKFPSTKKFTDSLENKPLMQRLWAGDNLTAGEEQINQATDSLALFLGCNSFVDYEIGRVLDVIERIIPDAMVIYTSDHGDMLGEHRLFSKNAAIYDAVTNIPVSYTHLDVYKRQVYHHCGIKECGAGCKQSLYACKHG